MFWLPIKRVSGISLTRQIYEKIRVGILKGDFTQGEKLPSSRTLAKELGVSRNIIMEAYEQLNAEGYVQTRKGSGTYVSEGTTLYEYMDEKIENPVFKSFSHSAQGSKQETGNHGIIQFWGWLPDFSRFPKKLFAKSIKESCLNLQESFLGYCDPLGMQGLREAVAGYLLRTKGINCTAEQVIITPAITEACRIIGQLLSAGGREIVTEDPLLQNIQKVFKALNYIFHPVPVDRDGMQVEEVPWNKKPNFILTTPSHQFPMACVMPVQRRIKLLEYASKKDVYIIENDYGSEFRLYGPPLSSLYLLDPQRVIHMGTFSASMCPAIRLAYMIMPESMRHLYPGWIEKSGWVLSSFLQLALENFINQGHLYRHINKLRKLYREKADVLIKELSRSFGNGIVIHGGRVGSYLMVEFKNILFSENIMTKMRRNKVDFDLVENHAIKKGAHKNMAVFGFGNLSLEQIRKGIERIKDVIAGL